MKAIMFDDEMVLNYLFVGFFFQRRAQMWNAFRRSRHPRRWEEALVRHLVASARHKEMRVMAGDVLHDLHEASLALGVDAAPTPTPAGGGGGGGDQQPLAPLQRWRRACCLARHLVSAEMKVIFSLVFI